MAKRKKNRRPKTNAVSLSADDQFADEATLGLRKDHIVHLQERDGNVALETTTATTSKWQGQGAVMENHTEVHQDNYTTTPLEPILLSNEPALESELTLLETIETTPGELSEPQMTPSEAAPGPTPITPTTFETTIRDVSMSQTSPSTPTLSLSIPFTCKMDPVVADQSPQPNNITLEPTLSEATPFICKMDPVVAMTTRSPQPVIKPNESKDANLARPNDTEGIVVDHEFHHNNPDPATHVYNGVKGIWAWGREHVILVSPFLKVTEGIANKVVGIVLHSSLREVDENLVRPIFGGLDDRLLNPVIHTIVSTSLGVGNFIGKNVISPLVSLSGIVGL